MTIQNENLLALTEQLKHYARFGAGKRPASYYESWIVEAETRLNATKERDQYIEKRYNRAQVEHE